jgi:hypothetical protein
MAAPAAPLAPVGFEALASLALILGFVVAWGLRRVWAASIGWLFVEMADLLDQIRLPHLVGGGHLFGSVSAFLRSVDKNVQHALSVAAMRCENGAAWLFNQAWQTLLWTARELADLAHSVERAIGNYSVTVVRPAIRVLDRKATARINALEAGAVRARHATAALITSKVAALEHRLARAIAIPAHAIAGVIPRVGRLERRASAQSHRLTKLEKATVGIGAAALVLTALKRLGLGWLRCSNVTRAGKAVCGVNPNLLESVLLDVAVLTIALDLRAFTRELQSVTGEAAHLIRSQIR